MEIRTLDGKTFGGIGGVCSSICAIQKTEALKPFNTLEEYVTYDGHKISARSPVSLKKSIPVLLQDLELYDLEGKVYSGDSNVFVKSFAECLVFFLKGFSILLCENKAKQKIKRITIKASKVVDGLGWLIPVMKAVGCCTRPREVCVRNVITRLESQGVY
jgi:hypothetical protein